MLPAHFLLHLTCSLLRHVSGALRWMKAFCKATSWLGSSHLRLRGAVTHPRWTCLHFLPIFQWCSQERNRMLQLLRVLHFLWNFVLVGDVSVQHEWRRVYACLERGVGRSHALTVRWFVKNTYRLNFLSRNWVSWSVLSEELGVGHCGVVKSCVVIHRSVEKLSHCCVSDVIVFAHLHVEVWNPTQFTIDISVFWHSTIVRHPGALEFVKLIWVQLTLRFDQRSLFLLELLVKILFVVSVIFFVKQRRDPVVPTVPLVLRWC